MYALCRYSVEAIATAMRADAQIRRMWVEGSDRCEVRFSIKSVVARVRDEPSYGQCIIIYSIGEWSSQAQEIVNPAKRTGIQRE